MGLGRKLAAVTTAVCAATALFTAAPADAAGQGIDWRPCPTGHGVECGKLTVPLDWDRPGDGTIQLALARRKAADPAHRIGSVLMDPGGPGGAGATSVQNGWALSAKVLARFDTVGFDPRGVGNSTQVRCGLTESTAQYPALPKSPAEFQQLLDHDRALGQSCARITGPLADHVDTRSVVRDMDAIRAALGDQKLTYYGVSYGTLMGQQYAETYPDRVRALVLDSNMDHSIHSTWEFLRTEAQATQSSFDQFVNWCDRTASCALHGQDVRAVLAGLYARAERGELGTPDDKIDPMALIGMVNSSFYGPTWSKLAERLVSLRDGKAPAAAFASDELSVPDPFNSIFCSDWRLPITSFPQLDNYRRALAGVAPDVHFSPLGWSAATGCAGWPGQVRNPQHALSVRPGTPVLMLNSQYDPATPYEWAVRASQQARVPLLTYDGWGHGAYFKNSQCVTDAADAFLIDGTSPGRGKHCAAVQPGAQSRMDGPRAPVTQLY
ncbi:alpha/beta hydrolase [Amycolatopsis benzoatilytica]|uniref:alpha/beta hydrolase n=1 Tax=Amycolatopsis benzoatilytica TaxID=346045 RepID=UPI00036121F4|nr:alpha/beta hydrolase [Amycolatopsis benzoatilytica]